MQKMHKLVHKKNQQNAGNEVFDSQRFHGEEL